MRGHMTNAEILMVVFTAVIAVTGVIGAIIFNGQLATMTAQLDEMKILSTLTKESITAANRAWIAPTAATLGKPLEDGLPARIQIRIVNVGREPALGLVWKVASILVPYIAPENGADANTENIGPNVVCHGLGPRHNTVQIEEYRGQSVSVETSMGDGRWREPARRCRRELTLHT